MEGRHASRPSLHRQVLIETPVSLVAQRFAVMASSAASATLGIACSGKAKVELGVDLAKNVGVRFGLRPVEEVGIPDHRQLARVEVEQLLHLRHPLHLQQFPQSLVLGRACQLELFPGRRRPSTLGT